MNISVSQNVTVCDQILTLLNQFFEDRKLNPVRVVNYTVEYDKRPRGYVA